MNFCLRPEGLYFIPGVGPAGDPGNPLPSNVGTSIQILPIGGGPARTVATLPRALRSGLSVSPDGRTFLFAQDDEAGSDLMLVENFR